MAEFRFNGGSDDLFEIDGAVSDEINCYDQEVRLVLAAPNGERLRVHGTFTDVGWLLGVSPVGEDGPVPPWPVRIEPCPSTAYSPLLIVTAPEGTRIASVDNHFA